MKTPLKVSVWTVCLNATLNVLAVLLLPEEWRHVGLAASTTLCAGVGCAVLTTAARRRNGPLGFLSLLPDAGKMLVAAVLMALSVMWVKSSVAGVVGNRFVSLAIVILSGADGLSTGWIIVICLLSAAAVAGGITALVLYKKKKKKEEEEKAKMQKSTQKKAKKK
jgi:Na+-driven multidrug efflux pump